MYAGRNLVDLDVPILVRQVDHIPEGHNSNADLLRVLADEFLGGVRRIERPTFRVNPGAGMVAPDDQVVSAIVAPDDRMPQRIARSVQAHGQRQKRQDDPAGVVVSGGQRPIRADPGEVVRVPRFHHPHDRVEQQGPVQFFDGTLGKLLMNTVQRVAGLEGDHVRMAAFGQPLVCLRRGQAERLKVIVRGQLKDSQAARDLPVAPEVHLRHQGCRKSTVPKTLCAAARRSQG